MVVVVETVLGVDGSKTVAAGSSKVVVGEVVVGEDVVVRIAIAAEGAKNFSEGTHEILKNQIVLVKFIFQSLQFALNAQ